MAKTEKTPTEQAGGALHSIGDAAEAAGLTPQALRMWEGRYGRPVAVRLPSGHRRYTNDQVRWLRRVADALAQGHRAGAVVPLGEEALSELLSQSMPDEVLGDGPRAILNWVSSYAEDEIRAWLEARWDADDYLTFLREEVAPLLVAVGRAWADGTLSLRHEHFLTEILEDELRVRRTEFSHRTGAPTVLFATLPGEQHALGNQMASLGAAAHGLIVRLLGVNTPIASIAQAAEELRPAMVAVSVSMSTGGADTDRALAELRRALPPSVRLVAGGNGMHSARRKPRGVEVPADLEAWDKLVADLAAVAEDAQTS